jgi:hypothetical protein
MLHAGFEEGKLNMDERLHYWQGDLRKYLLAGICQF